MASIPVDFTLKVNVKTLESWLVSKYLGLTTLRLYVSWPKFSPGSRLQSAVILFELPSMTLNKVISEVTKGVGAPIPRPGSVAVKFSNTISIVTGKQFRPWYV